MATAVNALAGAGQTDPQSASKAAANASPSKEMFLKLLVEQIRNQDPLNPADSVQFVSQLAQFSELEQVISIRELLEGAAQPAAETQA
jgi:flagellar basal-body rod modification protein FlgD